MKINKKGFTLIELLVVVLIIGILAAIGLPQYTKAVEKSRAAEGFQNIQTLRRAHDIYHMQTGTWPSSLEDLDVEMPASNKRFTYALTSVSRINNNKTLYSFGYVNPEVVSHLAGNTTCTWYKSNGDYNPCKDYPGYKLSDTGSSSTGDYERYIYK
ncbi:type IV pilus assembly protein PilE [Elusimicrobium simillimum]|uniref:type IV pilin protein n=1 Tax=Elusimicrobium simillimum TaxID=3143438 RepID=UPI003C700E19